MPCPVRIGSRRAEAGNRQINQTRVDVPQVVIPKAEFWHGLAQKILNQNIRAFDHATEDSFACLILQVDGDAALIAVDHHEGGGFTLDWRDETARAVAPMRAFDFDHVGAKISQMHRGRRAREIGRHIQNLNARERALRLLGHIRHSSAKILWRVR